MTLAWLRILCAVTVVTLLAAGCGAGAAETAGEGGEPGTETAATETAAAHTSVPSNTESDTGAGMDTEAAVGPDEPALTIGYILPETGQLAELGPRMIAGVRYAVDEINAAGGVLNEQIPDVLASDSGGDESIAGQSADRLLSQGVDAIIGAASSGISFSIIDRITGEEVVQCSPTNTAPSFTDYDDDGYYFRTAPTDALQGPILADTIVADGHSRVAILARADDYGRGLADATTEALTQVGATVVADIAYDPIAPSFTAEAQKALAANPDAVVVVAFAEGALIIKSLLEQGFSLDDTGLYGVAGLRSDELPGQVAPDNPAVLAGMKGIAPSPLSDPNFLEKVEQALPDLDEAGWQTQTAFDCVTVIALAAVAADSTDPTVFSDRIVDVTKGGVTCGSYDECAALLDEGKDVDYSGASGPLDFTEAGEPASGSYEIWTFTDEGDIASLETFESTLGERNE